MNFTYYGHSTVKFELNGVHLIIDPFLTSNPHTETNPLDVRADYVLLTHAHLDHVEDAETIARANDATIIATYELAMYYAAKGLKAFGMNLGGSATFPFGKLTLTQAFHSSSMDIDGVRVYMGMPAGLLIETDGTTVYHAGDTALFSDMKLYGERYEIDLAFLPIGDTYTMGPADATDAAGWLRAKRVVPIHYDTFPVIRQDAEEFCRNLGERGLYVRPNETKDV